MNMLRKLVPLRSAFARLMETSVEASQKIIAEPLTERELVRVQGDEVVPFLQGLVTNDMAHLRTEQSNKTASMYAMFLNKSGRVMFDSIIYRASVPNTFYIECDKNVSSDLKRHLRLYRVRRKIDIECADKEYKPWVVFSADISYNIDTSGLKPECHTTFDPRLKDLGHRLLLPSDMIWGDLAKMLTKSGQPDISTPSPECNYRLHRYRHGVGEGVNDIPPGKCFPLESNCDFLHGVSFHKGCYIGQELTARVYHTGVIRKRLMPLRLTQNPKKVTTVQSLAGVNLGTLRGFVDKSALALMRVQQVLNSTELIIDGESCYAEKPFWWPKELPSKASVREGN